MPPINQETLLKEMEERLTQIELNRLNFPLDPTSKSILKREVDGILSVLLSGIIEVKSIFYKRLFILTNFESLDGWRSYVTGSGVITQGLGSIYLRTGATINSKTTISVEELSIGGLITNKNSIFETYLKVGTLTLSDATIFALVGSPPAETGTASADDGVANGYGFKIVNGTLKAYTVTNDGFNKLETTIDISGVTLTNSNVFRAIYIPNNQIEYYVNGVLKAILTTNLPNYSAGVQTEQYFTFYITNGAASNKEFYIGYATFTQDL